MMKFILVACIIAAAFASNEVTEEQEQFAVEPQLVQQDATSLKEAIKDLKALAPTELHSHVNKMAKHAELLQDTKAKAYRHNFRKSQGAISAALRSLNAQLVTGHRHDERALKKAYREGSSSFKRANERGHKRVSAAKRKACPVKRLEEMSERRKKSAERKIKATKRGKLCPVPSTWSSMDVEKSRPKLSTHMRNKWLKVRSQYVRQTAIHTRAKRSHAAAVAAHGRSMAVYRTTLSLSARTATKACRTAHNVYNSLRRDVTSNSNMRKNVWKATLTIKCYVGNLSNTGARRACAARAQRTSTVRWNIRSRRLAGCVSTRQLAYKWGPKHWFPHIKSCRTGTVPTPPKTTCKNRCFKRCHVTKGRCFTKCSATRKTCTHKCHQAACSVTVYKHCNYGGYRINLRPGSYNMHTLIRKGMKNDDLSSIRVHGRCRARLYQHHNFGGKVLTKTGNDSCFTNDHMIPVSQLAKIEITSLDAEELVQAAEKKEEMALDQTSTGWGRRRRTTWNDQISSIRVQNLNARRCMRKCAVHRSCRRHCTPSRRTCSNKCTRHCTTKKPKVSPVSGKPCNSKAGPICHGYNLKCYRSSLAKCKSDCKKTRNCNLAEYNGSTCCLSKVATKKACPGKWARAHGWTGYTICH